jgi:hypothetical protein
LHRPVAFDLADSFVAMNRGQVVMDRAKAQTDRATLLGHVSV